MIPSARYLPPVPCWVPPAGSFAPNRMFYWAWLIRDALRREKGSVEWYDFRSLRDGFNRSDRIWKDYGNGRSTKTSDDPSWRISVSIEIDSRLIFLTKKIHIVQTTVSLCHSIFEMPACQNSISRLKEVPLQLHLLRLLYPFHWHQPCDLSWVDHLGSIKQWAWVPKKNIPMFCLFHSN